MARRDRFDRRPEDGFVKGMFSFMDYLSLHKTTGTVALIAVAGATLAGLAYWNHLRSYNRNALAAFESARTAEGYKNVVDSYPGSAAEPMALFARARMLIDAKQYDQAEAALSALVGSFPTHALAPSAQALKGMVFEQEMKFEDAERSYRELLSKYPDSFMVPLALLNMGICYEKLGREDEARKVYGTIVAEHADSAWKGEAERRLGALGGNVPKAESGQGGKKAAG
jgi:TolA-binding protein